MGKGLVSRVPTLPTLLSTQLGVLLLCSVLLSDSGGTLRTMSNDKIKY